MMQSLQMEPMAPAIDRLRLDELRASELDRALCDAERRYLSQTRSPQRRQAWLVGRYVAKRLLAETLLHDEQFNRGEQEVDLHRLQIVSRNAEGQAVRPVAMLDGRVLDVCLSISHTQRLAVAAYCRPDEGRLGVDVVSLETVQPEALRMWMSPSEQEWIAAGDARRRSAVCWGLKEATYKAINAGESFQPRRYELLFHREQPMGCRQDGRAIDGLTLDVDQEDGEVITQSIDRFAMEDRVRNDESLSVESF